VTATQLTLTSTAGDAGLRLELHLAADVDVPYVQRRLLEVVEELSDQARGARERRAASDAARRDRSES
jgi:hypothetical protein